MIERLEKKPYNPKQIALMQERENIINDDKKKVAKNPLHSSLDIKQAVLLLKNYNLNVKAVKI